MHGNSLASLISHAHFFGGFIFVENCDGLGVSMACSSLDGAGAILRLNSDKRIP